MIYLDHRQREILTTDRQTGSWDIMIADRQTDQLIKTILLESGDLTTCKSREISPNHILTEYNTLFTQEYEKIKINIVKSVYVWDQIIQQELNTKYYTI